MNSCFNCKKAYLETVEQDGYVSECAYTFTDEEADRAEAAEWNEKKLPYICGSWEQR